MIRMSKNSFISWLPLSIWSTFALLFINGCSEGATDMNPQSDDQTEVDFFAEGQSKGTLKIGELDEASGLAHSRSNPLYLWSHNDSGGEPFVYLFTESGVSMGRVELQGAENIDWEDMAIGVGPEDDVNYMFLADIGDNRAVRGEYQIYRFPEPELTSDHLPNTFVLQEEDYDRIEFIYEDGPKDAEALMIDPETKNIYLISKREERVGVYELAFPQETEALDTARRIMSLPFTYITAADISPSGREVLIKNYRNIYHWQQDPDRPLTIPQLLARPANRLKYTPEPQGEAIAWHQNEIGYYTLSERKGNIAPPILFYAVLIPISER